MNVQEVTLESRLRPLAPVHPSPGRVAVVGGGISGLAAAHFLVDAGARVTLFESSSQFGGLGSSFSYRDAHLDRFYHVLLPTDDDLLDLLKRLGIADRVYWRDTSLGFFHRRELFSLNTPLDLLRFKPARLIDRIRLGLGALYASSVARREGLDDISVGEWLTRLSGKRAFEVLWRPLLEAKFGEAYRQIPALWYWARFNREKGTKKEVKGYLRGGYKGLTETVVGSLRARGAELHLRVPVERLALNDGKVLLNVANEWRSYDRVVSTIPIPFLRRMISEGDLANRLDRVCPDVDYQGVVNVLVLLRRSLTNHYWIPVVDSGVPFRGMVETTRVIDSGEVGGCHLVYLLNYAHRTDSIFQRDPEDLKSEYVEALLGLIPGLSCEDVIDAKLFKAPYVEPIYWPGYERMKPPAEIVPDRVYLATTAQVYPDVTSWNSSISVARQSVGSLIRRVERIA